MPLNNISGNERNEDEETQKKATKAKIMSKITTFAAGVSVTGAR